ncbi:MAG: cysteine methyltransferase, partial [Actinobacteria bacterium]
MAPDLSLGFTSVPTPLGELTIVATDVGIVASGFPEDRGSFLAQVEERLGGRAAGAERALAAAR